ncbi:MAG TPA: HEPN domain-containing protein [Candidatus Korarchaeota archaeon]|nr:HEPN domain-containing protein [Candidatus Korarchaeota archaeon]
MEEYELYIERAKRAYRAFLVLRKEGLLEDAASRGYYAILHLSRALLVKRGESIPKTHAGLISKMWALRDSLGVSKELISAIARIQSLRERGDYGVIPSISEDELRAIDQVYRELLIALGEENA